MMEQRHTDVVVVGGGPGGYVAAVRAAQLGKQVVLVEREHLGGICLNWGCIPTKALLRSAELLRTLRGAENFGLSASEVGFDYPAVVARSRAIAARLSAGVAHLMKKNKVAVVSGHGTVTGPTEVTVTGPDGETVALVDASFIVLATGARTRDFPAMRINGTTIIGSRHALEQDSLPASLAILGAGSIGVEFADHFASFGVEVHLFEAQDRLLPLADADQSRELAKAFKKRRVKVYPGTTVTEVTGDGSVEVAFERKGRAGTVTVDRLLMAVGVVPNSEGLGLDRAGIDTERGFVKTNEFYQTSVESIYAIGDLAGEPCLAHVASAEAIVAVEHLAGKSVVPIDYANIPACTYATPQVASVGLTEAVARETYGDVRVGKFPMMANGKALALGETAGFAKAVVDGESGKLLGLHLVGSEATELLLEATLLRTMDGPVSQLLKSIHPHPTIGEGLHEAVAAALGEAIHL